MQHYFQRQWYLCTTPTVTCSSIKWFSGIKTIVCVIVWFWLFTVCGVSVVLIIACTVSSCHSERDSNNIPIVSANWKRENNFLSDSLSECKIMLIICHFLPQEHEQLSYSSTRTKAPSVIVSGLKPATWYIFSVRTHTPAGYSSFSPKYEFETTEDCKYLRRHLYMGWDAPDFNVFTCISTDHSVSYAQLWAKENSLKRVAARIRLGWV